MTELIFLVLIYIFKSRILNYINFLVDKLIYSNLDIAVYLSDSIEAGRFRILNVNYSINIYNIFRAVLISILLSKLLTLNIYYTFICLLLIIIISIVRLISRINKSKLLLVEQLSDFIFAYEFELLKGNAQLNSLIEAIKRIDFIDISSDVDGFIKSFNSLFRYSKMLVVKRISILIERNKIFTTANLSMEFIEVGDEINVRFYNRKKVEMEKKENLILIPMIGNMLIMMLYSISPFLLS